MISGNFENHVACIFVQKFQGLASNWPTVFTRDTTNDSAKARTSLELGTMAGKFDFLGEKGGKNTFLAKMTLTN